MALPLETPANEEASDQKESEREPSENICGES